MKMAGTGATFPSTPGTQRVLETSLFTHIDTYGNSFKCQNDSVTVLPVTEIWNRVPEHNTVEIETHVQSKVIVGLYIFLAKGKSLSLSLINPFHADCCLTRDAVPGLYVSMVT
jgi:hypothetical protein